MKADSEHILRTKKGNASSKKVYLAGSIVNEETEECAPVSQPINGPHGVSGQSVMT